MTNHIQCATLTLQVSEIFGTVGADGGVYDGDGDDSPPNDNSVVDSTFVPPSVNVNTDSPNCSYYEEDGYYCVPYYQCEEGEIVVDGGAGGREQDSLVRLGNPSRSLPA